ncbi:MAG: hypothetical protein ACYDC2_06670 [Solirubrobacteraceae bacterium]
MRTLWARAGALLAALALCSAFAPPVRAANVEGGSAFSELAQKAQEEPAKSETSTTARTASKEEVHNDNKTLLLGLGAAVALLLAVAFVIVRDARRAAPAGAEDVYERERRKGRDTAVKQANRRAKAKAARAQRRRNR